MPGLWTSPSVQKVEATTQATSTARRRLVSREWAAQGEQDESASDRAGRVHGTHEEPHRATPAGPGVARHGRQLAAAPPDPLGAAGMAEGPGFHGSIRLVHGE